MTERTFSIIKPDATKRNLTGKVNAVIEDAGLRIVAQKRIKMSRQQAEAFYDVHKERPFFGELVDFMISEPVVVQVLEGDNAVARYREVMGATNPEQAAEGTIRKQFALSIGEKKKHYVLRLDEVPMIDPTGAFALGSFIRQLRADGATVTLAGASAYVTEQLRRSIEPEILEGVTLNPVGVSG